MPTRAEIEFHKDMLFDVDRMTKEIGYNPTRFRQMIDEHGGVEAARILIARKEASEGFTRLWEAGRLEMSCEAYALLPWYRQLFSDDERVNARNRLIQDRFDVMRFEQESAQSLPAWFVEEMAQ